MRNIRTMAAFALVVAGGILTPGSSLAQGTIIYINQPTNFGGIYGVPWTGDFDVDGDGVPDYRFDNDGAVSYVSPVGSNRQIAYPAVPRDMGSYLTPLFAGEVIGSSLDPVLGEWVDVSSQNLGWHSSISGCFNVGCSGTFAYRTAYMGIDYVAGDGLRHFGWIKIDDTIPGGHVYLLEWAWAVTPGESIMAGAVPEPSTFVFFGIGSAVLWRFRKRR